MPDNQTIAATAPAGSAILKGVRKHRTGWIVFGVVVALLVAAAFTLYALAKANYRNNVRMVMARHAASIYSYYEREKGVSLADDPQWQSTLISSGYLAPETLWSTAATNEQAKFVMVSYPPEVAATVGSSWACFYDDPALLKPGAKACIVFPDMEVIQVPPPDLLDEIRKGLASRNLPYDAAHPGLQPAKSVAK